MTNTLLVPIHLDALYLPANTSVLEEMTDYRNLPYSDKANILKNSDKAYISSSVLSPPFENLNLTLGAGIHLHWAMPDALTEGKATVDGITFPLVPNRWLIVRRGGNTGEKQWVIESDYLYPDGVDRLTEPINILHHPDRQKKEYQPFRLLGRKWELTEWRSAPTNAQYVEALTVIGPFAKVDNLDNEKAAFAGFYPNCRSVFGFHDPEFKGATPPAGLKYDVIGWYSNSEKDCLAQFLKEHSANNDRTLLEVLQEKLGWTVTLNNQSFPDRILCYSQLTFAPGSSLADPAATLPNPAIAVGNTQEEAIAAYLARQLDSSIENRKIIEEQLEALQLSDRLEQQKLDFGPKFREVVHESGFAAVATENLWRVVPEGNESGAASAAQGEAQMQVTLPTSIGDRLNTTNNLQHEYDRKLATIGSIREQVYADWYKYMMALYLREKGYSDFYYKYVRSSNISDKKRLPDPETIREFIRTDRNEQNKGLNECGLPALQEEMKATGALSFTRDGKDEIATASAPNSEANSIAARLAQSINNLIADINRFNKESRFLVAPPNSSAIAFEGSCALVEEPVAGKCLRFDGNQNYFKVSGLNNVRAISMWVKIPDVARGWRYLLDARNHLADSGFTANSSGGIGGNWEKMYVDGKEQPLDWARVPKNQWIFLYLQAKSSFSGALHLMSNHNRTENLPGDIASVCFHQQPLSPEEIQRSKAEKSGLLRPSYILKVVPGPRYWQPSDPVILMTGDAVTPTRRLGEDTSLREDGLLECQLLTDTIDLQKLQSSTLEILKGKLEAIALTPGEKIGFHNWTNQPWNPFLLEWAVQFFPLQHSRQNNSTDYDSNTLKENYELRVNAVDLLPKNTAGGNYFGGTANLYSGASFLTPSATTLLKENLIAYLKKNLLPAYHEAQKTAQDRQTEDFLSQNFNEVKRWYEQQKPSASDAAYTALRAYEQLQSLKCLAQSIGGFNDALLTYQRTMQLEIKDTRLKAQTGMGATFLQQVRENVANSTVPGSLLRSPYLLNDFNPIRAGALKISGLRIVDTFGRVKVVVDITNPQTTEVVTSQPMTPPLNCPHPIYLPPRLAQPARLNFRWLSATQGQQEMNDHPTTTPICGWILPNNLDSSLTIYDNKGNPLGIINRRGIWQAIPGSNQVIAIDSIANRYLRQLVEYLVKQGESFFRDFLTAVNKALETIDPESFAQNQAISLLVARPLALVRSQVNLELQGLPAISQNSADMKADVLVNRYRTTSAFPKIKFPIRIGEYQQLNDSLIGYWVETAEGAYKDNNFYAPQSCFVPHPQVKTLFDNAADTTPDTPVNLEQTLEANTAQTLVMLVDPRGQVHASCGVLPAKTISIPPEQYVTALGAIEVTFLSAPLLSDLNQINLSLPEVPGYAWSWLGKEENNWSAVELKQFNSQATLSSPQKIYEGWLKLTRKTPNL